MPTAAHIFAGLVVGLLLYQASQKKFTPYHVLLFTVQGIVGPDLGWLFSDLGWSVATFIHSAFGFAVSAFILAIPFRYLGRVLKYPIRYSDVYKLTVAGGITHTCIDGLGHLWNPLEVAPFGLFSYDIVDYFLHTTTGNYILVGAIAAFILGIGVTYHHFAHEKTGNRIHGIKDTFNAMYPFPAVVGALLLLRLMPFGNNLEFFMPEAINYTSVGVPQDAYWIYISPILVFVAIAFAAKKAPRLVLPIGLGYAAIIFLVLVINPAAGGGEGDLGMTYVLLLFIALPALLLGTSFHKDSFPLPETRILGEKASTIPNAK